MNATELDERGVLVTCPKCGQRNRLNYHKLGQSGRCGNCGDELQTPGQPIDVNNDREFDALTTRPPLPVLVDFWAPWCGPCKMVAPELVKVAHEGSGRWLVAKVNTENASSLARRFRINAIPTMALLRMDWKSRARSVRWPHRQSANFSSRIWPTPKLLVRRFHLS